MKAQRILVRPARREDRAAMLSISRTVWEGTDYLPFVWDEWLTAPDGSLMVAEVDGRVVGLQHIAVQPDGVAWLEGIRVAEEVRGRRVGRVLLEHGLEWARLRGCPGARLATASLNPASERLAAGGGLHRAATYIPYASGETCPGAGGLPVHLAPATAGDELLAFLARHGVCVGSPYTEGWTAYSLTPQRVALLLATGAVLLAGESRTEAVGVATAAGRPTLKLGLLAGSEPGMRAIAGYAHAGALAAGLRGVQALTPPVTSAPLESAGYHRRGTHVMHLWERSL